MVATVSSKERSGFANLLLDNASQLSFISACFNLDRGFKVVNVIPAAYLDLEAGHDPDLSLIANNGGRFPIQVMAAPPITNPIGRGFLTNPDNFPHLRGLRLAHL